MRTLSITLVCWALFGAGTIQAETNFNDSFVYETNEISSTFSGSGNCGCDTCDTCDCCDYGRWFLLPQDDCGINIHGWIDAGVIGNTDSPRSKFNGPYNAVDRSNEVMMNQFYLVAEKELSSCCWGLGGRVDVMYGEDFFLAESIGMEKRQNGSSHWNGEYYGLAIPQAYISAGSRDLNIQMGHFYSVVGYEGVMAPANFFYSKAYSYQFAGPFTHWGAQVNWTPSDAWELSVGVHNGWDALDRTNDRAGMIAKVKYNFCRPGTWTSFALTTGDEANNPASLGGVTNDITNRTRYSWIVNVPFRCDWEYVFHHWFGRQEDGAPGRMVADWYGIDQYLHYTINDCWKVGARFEWFRDVDGTRVGLNRPRNPNNPPLAGDYYSFTFGVNWMPTENLTIRPEVRADWFDGAAGTFPYDDGNDDSQVMFGIDGILLF